MAGPFGTQWRPYLPREQWLRSVFRRPNACGNGRGRHQAGPVGKVIGASGRFGIERVAMAGFGSKTTPEQTRSDRRVVRALATRSVSAAHTERRDMTHDMNCRYLETDSASGAPTSAPSAL